MQRLAAANHVTCIALVTTSQSACGSAMVDVSSMIDVEHVDHLVPLVHAKADAVLASTSTPMAYEWRSQWCTDSRRPGSSLCGPGLSESARANRCFVEHVAARDVTFGVRDARLIVGIERRPQRAVAKTSGCMTSSPEPFETSACGTPPARHTMPRLSCSNSLST